ncbi:PrsW family intramembrane metalloprotease [Candidatus Bathyarchaeota archaeon]|nr:PrsW family intramembrane metalloprotease [Candidatus Bathyarchaeota archaeon]
MIKKVLIAGIVGLVFGLFVFDYFVSGIPLITVISLIVIIAGVTGKRKEQPLPTIQIPQQIHCTSCGAPLYPTHKFCTYCGAPNPYYMAEPQPQYQASPALGASLPPQPAYSGVDVSTGDNITRAFMNLFVERAPMGQISNAVYEKLDPVGIMGSMKLFLVSAALFVGFYLLFFGGQAYSLINNNLVYFVATYSVAIIYLIIVYRTDKYEKEPFKFVLFVFVWGVFCGVIAAPLNDLIGPLMQASFGNASLIGPFTEEPLKSAGFYYLVTRKQFQKEFNTPLDGIVYGFAAGMGFFAMENFIYYLNPQVGGPELLLIRSLLLWGHGVWVATTGLWLAIAKTQRGYLKRSDLIPGMMVAITLHFLWNGWQGFLGYGLGWAAMIGQMIFQFWYMKKIIREALRDEVIWGYGQGMAPVE